MKKPLYKGHEVDILVARYAQQAEHLRSLDLYDVRIVSGFLTVQILLGAWIYTHPIKAICPKASLLLIDFALLVCCAAVLRTSTVRRWEIVETIWNINEALGLYEIGAYLTNKAINPECRKHRSFLWYYIISAVGFVGVIFVSFTRLAAADKLDEITARGLLVGVSETSPPFSARAGEQGVVGYDVDFAAHVARRLGVAMEKVSIINPERIPALQQDRVDLVASGMTRADNRRRDIGFSLAYLVSPHKILTRKESGITGVKQMAGRKLALVKSASVDAELKAAVPALQIVFFDDYAACFGALKDGRVDGFLADEVLVLSFAHKSGAPEDFALIPDYDLPRTAGFGIKKDEPRWKDFVDRTLLDLEASGEAARIFDAWFAPAPRPFRIAPD